MQKKIMSWKTKGMNRDLSVSAFNPEFSFENMNLRLATNDGNTMLSWVTEKGPNQMTFSVNNVDSSSISGIPIGTAVVGSTLVLFTTTRGDSSSQGDNNPDIIYTLNINFSTQKIDVDTFFTGNLQFDAEHPLETLVSYETDTIKKVYWVDGKNPFRMLNLSDKPVPSNSIYDNDVFNVLPTLQLQEEVYVDKIIGGSGKFASGVIQYAFTYFNKNGCESNIFYTSSLRYISPADRGGAPDEMVDNAFKIRIEKVDTRFDYIRIYSIHRSSLNGVPTCRRVADIDIRDVAAVVGNVPTVSYIDTGTVGDTIDPTELLFKNRETIIPSTIEQKDNTLFLGNIKKDSSFSIPDTIVLNHTLVTGHCTIAPEYNVIRMGKVDENSPFAHISQLNLYTEEVNNAEHTEHGVPCNGFKIGNEYRLGFQLQDKTGRWTDPIFIQNYIVPSIENNYHAKTTINDETSIGSLQLPGIKATINTSTSSTLIDCGYRKIRPLVVLPKLQERKIICQGVVNPTLFTNNGRNETNGNYAQSSWFFRPIPFYNSDSFTNRDDPNARGWFSKFAYNPNRSVQDELITCVASPKSNNNIPIPYASEADDYNCRMDKGLSSTASYVGNDLKTVEIQGCYNDNNKFKVDWRLLNFYSPDIELSEELYNNTFSNTSYSYVGRAKFINTLSDVYIQTTSPQIDGSSSGFIHNSYVETTSYGIISGLFYEDAVVEDVVSGSDVTIESFIDTTNVNAEQVPCKWLIYPWQRSGSINNDFNRPSGLGVQSAFLKKKVISNLRYSVTDYKLGNTVATPFTTQNPQVFFDEKGPLKLGGTAFYYGTVDSLLVPDKKGPLFYAFDGKNYNSKYGTEYDNPSDPLGPRYWFYETHTGSRRYWKAWQTNDDIKHGLYKYENPTADILGFGGNPSWGVLEGQSYNPNTSAIGDKYSDLVQSKDAVRMRYKGAAHMVIYDEAFVQDATTKDTFPHNDDRYECLTKEKFFFLPIYEIQRNNVDNIFGGTTLDALKANVWIVCGKEERLKNSPVDIYPTNNETVIHFSQGDNYYQRYDCLKTYAYSPEDVNQIVEIGSFMLEGYSNIDGRYDRNRGQVNNTNMNPQNFNLINSVYSQPNNFFNYKIVEDNNSSTFINYLTWSLPKISGEDIDSWTYLTLANTLELEGNKGQLNSIKKFRNQLIAFQDLAISQILYNENVQITSTEGVPIEIANSGKVEGYRYLSNIVGCSNKWSIVETPEGLYFMDGANKAIYLFNGGFNNISATGGFASWSTQNIAGVGNTWTPIFKTYPQQFGATEISPFVSYYDNLNHEVLFINADVALAWNERTQTFTSFYNYEDTPYFVTLGDFQLWLRSSIKNNAKYITAWHHQAGEETCNFFGERQPYWMTLIGNPEPQTKMFTNLEFRACVEGDGTWNGNLFTPTLPFNNLEVWNEYQHGIATLQNSQGHDLYSHHSNDDNTASLVRKFRIWRCDIPRDNAMVNPIAEAPKGIFREKCHPISRIRNPWVYLNVKKTPYVTYTCIKVPGTKGFLIPISEFEHYHEDTGLDACDIQIVDYVGTNLNVLYHLVDSSTMNIKYNYDSHTYYQLPLGQMHITDPTGGIVALGETYEADALFIDCSGWNFDPTTVELTIGRTLPLTRTEIHDLTLTYYN